MIRLTAEEYETLLRDAKRYRGSRLIFVNPAMSEALTEVVDRFTSERAPTLENFDELVDLMIEASGITEKDLLP